MADNRNSSLELKHPVEHNRLLQIHKEKQELSDFRKNYFIINGKHMELSESITSFDATHSLQEEQRNLESFLRCQGYKQ